MNEILEKTRLSQEVVRIVVRNPEIATHVKPGQFAVLRVREQGERIPLTLSDWDTGKGTITLIFQEIGLSTKLLGELDVGNGIQDLLGPLGKPSEIEKTGLVVGVGGGVGVAPLLPVLRGWHDAGNETIAIIGARRKDLIILEDEFRKFCARVEICTDDGSYGKKGFVSNTLGDLLTERKPNVIFVVGPAIMMKVCSDITKESRVKTIASLNPLMVDASGMCGACRVEVGGETKFGCVDGPEFDAHLINFDLLMKRQNMYRKQEEEVAENV